MPTVALVFAPDPELGPDPLDATARADRSLGELIPAGTDMLVVWREWGEQFEGGSRTHVVGDGAWANVTVPQIEDTLATLGSVD